MLTDASPRRANRSAYLESDRITTLDLPQNEQLLEITKRLEPAMKTGTSTDVRKMCAEFLAAKFYKVPPCWPLRARG